MSTSRTATLLLSLAVTVLSTGCATIFKGSTQNINITSNVEGAAVLLDGQRIGSTPFFGMVKKGGETLVLRKEGFKDAEVKLQKGVEPTFFLNILCGGLIGTSTDASSGSITKYDPGTYQIDLQPVAQPTAEFQHEVAVRRFAMLHLNDIATDLSAGGGAHLTALLELVNGDGPARLDAAGVRDALEASGGSKLRFGDRIVARI